MNVDFGRTGAKSGPYARTKASSVSTTLYFYFLRDPAAAVLEPVSETQRRDTDLECAKLDRNDGETFFFTAVDEAQAVRGNWLGQSLLRQMHTSPLPFEIKCDSGSVGAECAKAWDYLKDETNIGVYDCEDGEIVCDIDIGVTRFDLVLSAPTTISSVFVRDQDIVIADPLKD